MLRKFTLNGPMEMEAEMINQKSIIKTNKN